MQREELAQVGDDMGHAVNHGAGRAVLDLGPVHRQPHAKRLRIGNLVGRHQPRAGLAKVVAGLALGPLARTLGLERTFRHVVDHAIAGNVGQSLRLGDVFRGLADDDAKLDLPVGFLAGAGDQDRVIRAADGRGGLHEDHRFRRNLQAAFGSVVRIVQADADELAGARDACTKSRRAGNNRQGAGVQGGKFGQPGQHVARKVTDHARKIADLAVCIKDAGLFLAARAIAEEFHLWSFMSGGQAGGGFAQPRPVSAGDFVFNKAL